MYPINNPYAFQEDGLTKVYVIIDGRGTLTESNLIQGTFQIDRYASSSIAPDIGNVASSELNFSVDKSTTDIQVQIGDRIECTLEKGSATIGAGHFIVISVHQNIDSYDVVCLDKMILLDAVANINVTFPITARNFLTQVFATGRGIPVNIDSGYNATLYNPNFMEGTTYRNILSYVCELMGANAYMDWNGEIRIGWYGASVCELGSDKRAFSQITDNTYSISEVYVTDDAKPTVEVSESNIILYISNNPFLANATETQKTEIQTQLRNRLRETSFYGASASVLPMPVLFPMDSVTWASGVVVPITRVTFGLNTNTKIECEIENRDNAYNFDIEKRVTDRTSEISKKYTDEAVQGIRTYVDGEVDILEGQIDQKIETFYQSTDPSLGWASGDWSKHEGDLWYDTSLDSSNHPKNETKRWNGTEWVLQNVPTEVFDEIDGKAQIFISQPTTPYAVGDLWFNSATSDIMTCIRARSSGNYTASDWQKRNKYTDDSALTTFINGDFATLSQQVDLKVETYYQNTDPSTTWTTTALKNQHKGDYWYDTSTNKTYRWSGTAWQQQNVPTEVFDLIDGKATIFTGTTTPTNPSENDLWFKGVDEPILTYINGSWIEYNEYTKLAINGTHPNLTPFFSWTDIQQNRYWISDSRTTAISFTPLADGWVRVKRAVNTGSGISRRDLINVFNGKVKRNTDYTFLCEFRNNRGTSGNASFYTVQQNTTPVQFWGANIKKNLEGQGATTSNVTFGSSGHFPPNTEGVYIKRFVKTSEPEGSSYWTDDVGMINIVFYVPSGADLDIECRLSVYEGEYLGAYKPYVNDWEEQISGVNLFVEKDSLANTYITASGGTQGQTSPYYPVASDYIAVDEGDIIQFQCWIDDVSAIGEPWLAYCIYDANKTAITNRQAWFFESGKTHVHQEFVVPSGGAFIRVSGRTYGEQGNAKFKVEKGTRGTSYTKSPVDEEAELEAILDGIEQQIDGKIESYYQSANPSTNWTAEEKAKHEGDFWYYTGTTTSTLEHNATYRWSGTAWVKQDAPEGVFDKIDGKATIFSGSTPPSNPSTNDLWFKGTDEGIFTYINNTWVEYNKYTDDTAVENLEIGGRNLLRNSGDFAEWNKVNTVTIIDDEAENVKVADFSTVTSASWREISTNFDVELTEALAIPYLAVKNKTLTLSFWARTDEPEKYTKNNDLFGTGALRTKSSKTRKKYGSFGNYGLDITTEWKKFTATAEINEAFFNQGTGTIEDTDYFYIQIYNHCLGNMQVKKPMLEIGNKPTDWKLSPEDVTAYTDDKISNLEIGGVNLLPDSNAPSYTRIAGTTDRYISDSGQSSYISGEFFEVTDPPVAGIKYGYRLSCTTANPSSTKVRGYAWQAAESLIQPKDGETYTLSCYVRKASGTPFILARYGYRKTGTTSTTYPESVVKEITSEKWEKFSYTFVYGAGNETVGTIHPFYPINLRIQALGVIEACGFKLEKGSKATEWSPSPIDTSVSINTALESADGKSKIFHQASAPTSGMKTNDVWFDTDDGYKMYRYNGTSWVAEQFGTNALANLSITNAKIVDGTIQSAKISSIDAGKITTGVLSAITIEGVDIKGSRIMSERTETESGVTTTYTSLIQDEFVRATADSQGTTRQTELNPEGLVSILNTEQGYRVKTELRAQQLPRMEHLLVYEEDSEGQLVPQNYTDWLLTSTLVSPIAAVTILDDLAKDPRWTDPGSHYLYYTLKELLASSRFLRNEEEAFDTGPYMGHLTNALKDLNVFFPHYKNADGLNLTTANVTLPTALIVRTTGGTYLNGSGSSGIPKANLTVKSVTHRAGGFNVVFGMKDGSAFTSATNNTPVSVMVSGTMKIKLT